MIHEEAGMQLVREIRAKLYIERRTMTPTERYECVRQNAAKMLEEIEQIRQAKKCRHVSESGGITQKRAADIGVLTVVGG